MKRLKLFLWILILFIIEIVGLNRIDFFRSAPDLVFAFTIAYVMLEEDYTYAIGVGIICGIAAGALCSDSFPISVLMYSYSALIVKALRNKPRYIPDFAKALFWVFVLSAAGETIMYFALTLTLSVNVILTVILPLAVYNSAALLIIYPIVKKTLVVVDEKKKLIPD